MLITPEQEAIIKSLDCKRLTSNDAFKSLITTFENRNKSLQNTLTNINEAWSLDNTKDMVYYIVRSEDGLLLFYFSLQCGALFEELDIDKLRKLHELADVYLNINNSPTQAQLNDILQIQMVNGFSNKEMQKCFENINDSWDSIEKDKKEEKNNEVILIAERDRSHAKHKHET